MAATTERLAYIFRTEKHKTQPAVPKHAHTQSSTEILETVGMRMSMKQGNFGHAETEIEEESTETENFEVARVYYKMQKSLSKSSV